MGRKGNFSDFSNSLIQATLYHGTDRPDIDKFTNTGRESNGAIFFADDSDYAEEEAYVKNERSGNGQYLYEVKLNIQNPYTVILPGNEFGDPSAERKYIQQAKAEGRDSVIFKETGNPLGNQTFYAVFSPDQVKIERKKKL